MARPPGFRHALLVGLTAVTLGLAAAYLRHGGESHDAVAKCPYGCPEVLEDLVVTARHEKPAPAVRLPGGCNNALVTIFYDGDSRPLRAEHDCNHDGRTDRWEELAADGSARRIEIDRDFDGTVDVVEPSPR